MPLPTYLSRSPSLCLPRISKRQRTAREEADETPAGCPTHARPHCLAVAGAPSLRLAYASPAPPPRPRSPPRASAPSIANRLPRRRLINCLVVASSPAPPPSPARVSPSPASIDSAPRARPHRRRPPRLPRAPLPTSTSPATNLASPVCSPAFPPPCPLCAPPRRTYTYVRGQREIRRERQRKKKKM